jgi:hypothetical protein
LLLPTRQIFSLNTAKVCHAAPDYLFNGKKLPSDFGGAFMIMMEKCGFRNPLNHSYLNLAVELAGLPTCEFFVNPESQRKRMSAPHNAECATFYSEETFRAEY